MSTKKDASTGSSLVEILIAIALFSITITAVTLMYYSGREYSMDSLASRVASEKLHDSGEALRFIRDTKWSTLTDGVHGFQFLSSGSWAVTSSPDVSDEYTRKASVSTDSDGIKHVDLTVSWHYQTEATKSLELYQTLAPPDQGLSGDWTHPCILSTADGGRSKGSDVFFSNYKAYVTSSAVQPTKKIFYL